MMRIWTDKRKTSSAVNWEEIDREMDELIKEKYKEGWTYEDLKLFLAKFESERA